MVWTCIELGEWICRSKDGFMDIVKEHMQRVCVRWGQMICCGDPNREQMKEEDFNDMDLSGVVKVLVLL